MADPESRVAGWDEFENEAGVFVAAYCLGARWGATVAEIAEVLNFKSKTSVFLRAKAMRDAGVPLPLPQRGRCAEGKQKEWDMAPRRVGVSMTSANVELTAIVDLVLA